MPVGKPVDNSFVLRKLPRSTKEVETQLKRRKKSNLGRNGIHGIPAVGAID